jgi:hypothetical protein
MRTSEEDVHHGRRVLAAATALIALGALLVGGSLMALTATPTLSIDAVLARVRETPAPFVLAGLALALISLADLGTIPALHQRLRRQGPVLILLATGTAVVGDLLGVLGRLAQTAQVPIALSPRTDLAPSAAMAADVLDLTLNTAGFLLVSVSFVTFGVLLLRDGQRMLGVVGCVAGVCTAVGQLPVLSPVFLVANLAFVLWYAALARLFARTPRTSRTATRLEASAGATVPAS